MNPFKTKPAKTYIFSMPSKRSIDLAAMALVMGIGLGGCSKEEHQQDYAADKVDAAAEFARDNAPEAEIIEFETTQSDQGMETEQDVVIVVDPTMDTANADSNVEPSTTDSQ